MNLPLIEYAPLDYVTVTAFGFDLPGRVVTVEWVPGIVRYRVEYRMDDSFQTGIFIGDEIKARLKNDHRGCE